MKILHTLKKVVRQFRNYLSGSCGLDEHGYLRKCKRLLHVGGNDGYERDLYAAYGLDVLWVEANPAVFQELVKNLNIYPRQRAVQALVTDKDGDVHDFHISNNDGLSSSIFELKDHRKLWPEVEFTGLIKLQSKTLETVVRDAGALDNSFDGLVLDVQGAEQLVIMGAGRVLEGVSYIKVEAADFESYAGACTLESLTPLLADLGFHPERQTMFKRLDEVGSYYDVLFKRKELRNVC